MSTHHPAVTLPQRRYQGDVHVGSMAGDVRPAPHSNTPEGERAIAELMRGVLERVRRHLADQRRARLTR